MLCNLLIWLSIWNWNTEAQQSFQIEDIPIEYYTHEEHQNDEIDVELIPRSTKPLPFNKNNYPSDLAFRESRQIQQYFDDLTNSDFQPRPKRDVAKNKTTELIGKVGKPLELLVINYENKTETTGNKNATKFEKKESGRILLNDFIRFKRSTIETFPEQKNVDFHSSAGKFIQANPQGAIIGGSRKLTDPEDDIKDITRETRGATKEQWVKQAYPVQRDESSFDDNVKFQDAPVRAPRVTFVTNGMQDRDPLDYKFMDRKVISRSLNKYSPSDLSAEMDYYQPRFARNYVPRDRYYERYPNDPRYSSRQDYPDTNRNYYDYNPNRKRRIIYYATLPDPPKYSVDDNNMRYQYDRYAPRDRYEDGYLSRGNNYYRKRYYDYPPRYPEDRLNDPTYPVKISTDVKVREVKKNPERRIYSDVDRSRYDSK